MAAARGTEDFRRAAAALNEAGDRTLRNKVYAAFRDAARPLGQAIADQAGAELPRRGGLGARVAAAKIGQSNSTTGRNPGVALRLRSPYHLRELDNGVLRHPVFARAGRRRVWVQARVKPGAFSRPFEAGADEVRRKLVEAVSQTVDEIARRGTHKGA